MKIYIILILLLFNGCLISAQYQRIEINSLSEIVRLTEKLDMPRDFCFWLPVSDTPNQTLTGWSTSASFDSIQIDEINSKVTVNIPHLKKKERHQILLKMVIDVRPSFYDDFDKYDYESYVDADTMRYLSTSALSMNEYTKIQKIAHLLIENERHKTVSAIIRYIHRKYKFDLSKLNANGIEKTMKSKYLSLSETVNLMVAMCRVANIPARIIQGHIVKNDLSRSYTFHNWVEVYISGKGWVNYDPYFSGFENYGVSITQSEYQYLIYEYLDHFIKPYKLKVVYNAKSAYAFHTNLTFRNINNVYMENASKFYLWNSKEAILRFDSILAINPYDHRALMFKAVGEAREQNFENGLSYLQLALKFADTEEQKANVLYAFANYFALKKDKEKFLNFLDAAILKGYKHYMSIVLDNDLAEYRNDPDFKRIVDRIRPKN